MPNTDWVAELKVVELKEECKKRGLAVSGKKAELAERLEAYIAENEVREAQGRGGRGGRRSAAAAAATAAACSTSKPAHPWCSSCAAEERAAGGSR